MGKYDPLREYLTSQIGHVNKVEMTFAEVERLVGRLPAAARVQRAWWETTNAAEAGAHAWLSAGWRVQSVDQGTERVIFYRDKTVTRDLSIALGAATAAGVAAGVSGIIGITHLPWWALALLCAAAGAVGLTVTQAIILHHTANTARWWAISTMVILLACAGMFTYHEFFDPLTHRAQTYQFVVNGNENNFIPLYGEAGGLEQSLATGYAGKNGLIGGQTYDFDCWTIGRDGAKWFRYERFGQTWWAPSALLHFPAGENQTGMPHC